MGPLTKLLLFLAMSQTRALYYPLREYSGSTFFDKWDYYGFVDNTTWGESRPRLFLFVHVPTLPRQRECNIPRPRKRDFQRPDIHQPRRERDHQSR